MLHRTSAYNQPLHLELDTTQMPHGLPTDSPWRMSKPPPTRRTRMILEMTGDSSQLPIQRPPAEYPDAVQALVLYESASGRSQVDVVPEAMDSEDLPALDTGAESDEDGEDEVSEPSQVVGGESYRGGDEPYYIDDCPTQEEMHAAYNPPRPWWLPPASYIVSPATRALWIRSLCLASSVSRSLGVC